MPKIIRFHETGGADVLKIEELPLTEPGEGEVHLKVEAIGLQSGALKPIIDRTFPLDAIAEAHQYMEFNQ